MVFERENKEKKCKLIILTGFFGSGKTTLIQHIIKTSKVKIGIIENDLAEINIDGKLLTLNDANIQVISNACICCSGNKHISESIDLLLSTHDNLEYIFIETTGLANPFKVKKALFGASVKHQIDYLGTICIVDAKHTLERENIEEQIVQIGYSDSILISKIDLVNTEKINSVLSFISNINPLANIDNILNGKYELDLLLTSLENKKTNFENSKINLNNTISIHEDIKTYCLTCDLVNPLVIIPKIINLVTSHSILRCKGIMKFPNSRDIYIFHGVNKELDLKQETVEIDMYNSINSSFVFICKEVEKDIIDNLFNEIKLQ